MKFAFGILSLILCSTQVIAQGFYNVGTLNTIELEFAEENWDEILDSLYEDGDEGRLTGNALINGEPFNSVGVRYKGNSSYDPDNAKNPFNIKLDYIIENQAVDNYSTLKLSNCVSDPTFLREVLGYETGRKYIPASQANYANVYVNGALIGLYINVESVNKTFTENHFQTRDAAYFKGEIGDEIHYLNQVWLHYGPDTTLYSELYEIESDYGWEALEHFLDVFNNSPAMMEEVLDVDRLLWFIGLQDLMVNLDSPLVWARNYYVCQDAGGKFNPVLWDLNNCFGLFNVAFGYGYLNLQEMQELDPFLNSSQPNYGMIYNVLNDPTYKQMYIAHMKTMVEENFTGGMLLDRALEIQSLIAESVRADTNKNYTYEEFLSNVRNSLGYGTALTVGLTELMDARADFILDHRLFLGVPPVCGEITCTPFPLPANSMVWFNVEAENAAYVMLGHRNNNTERFSKTEMFDDGLHNDGLAGDGVYGAGVTTGYYELQYYLYCENDEAGRFYPERAESEYYTLPIMNGVCINEFMADNETIITDPQGEFEDWIEIFNNSYAPVILDEYYLTDDFTQPDKWAFPDTSLAPGGFLLIWADDDTFDAGLHTNFKLNKTGEQLGLYIGQNENLFAVDQIEFGVQAEDTSFGRLPDGEDNWVFLQPTPGYENQSAGVIDSRRTLPAEFSLLQNFPNPFNNRTRIEIVVSSPVIAELKIYNVEGREIMTLQDGFLDSGVYSFNFDASRLAGGIYFAQARTENETAVTKMLLLK